MITNKFKTDTLIERCYCDDCKVEMVQQDAVKASLPQQFEYKCPKCEKTETDTISYPRVIYVEYALKR